MIPDMTCPNCGAAGVGGQVTCPRCGVPLPPRAHPSGLSSEARGWAIGAHLGGLGLGLASGGVLGFAAPLFVWLLKGQEHEFVDHHGKEALNFQLTAMLVIAVAVLLTVPAVIVGVLTLGIGLLVMGIVAVAAAVAWFVLPIVAAVHASNGEGYRYPVSVRFVR